MKNIQIIILSSLFIALLEGNDQEIQNFQNQITEKKDEAISLNIDFNPHTSQIKLSLPRLDLIKRKDIGISDTNYKNDYEKSRFKKQISLIPRSSQFIIHLDNNDKIYKITNVGNIFALDVSHTRAHEKKLIHSHSSSATLNLSAMDLRQNTSIILATKEIESFKVLEAVSFGRKP